MRERALVEKDRRAAAGSNFGVRRLLDVLPAAAYICDTQGLITYFNEHAVEVWGREPKLNDPMDRFCGSFKLFASDGSPIRHEQCWMALALQEDKEYNGCEIIVERSDGSRRTALAHANPFRDERGTLTGAVNILVDITDRKRSEDALREADRRKDEFLAILAHELRNPLAPMRNALQLLRLGAGHEETLEQARDMMERQLKQMVRLVDDLTDASRITRNKLVLRKERVELASVVHSAVESIRPLVEQCGHQLSIIMPPQPIFLHADPVRLAQVFCNLLSNAAKYTERGGHIWVSAAREGDELVVMVRDTGIGIPASELGEIFEPFKQLDRSLERAQGGLGIGLSLARGLVEMHGGRLAARSDGPGNGSEFSVTLPLLAEGTSPEPQTSGLKPQMSSKCRILVVDDNEDTAASLAIMLDFMGHHTCVAHDGVAAVEAAQEFQPEVVLLDIGMPKLNGYDAARKIRGQSWGQTMFLIAMTGWGQDEDKHRSACAGFNLHMTKPVDPGALENLLTGLQRKPLST